MSELYANQRKWTYNDYLEIDDDKRYELLNGDLVMAPAPESFHQICSINLAFAMLSNVREHELGTVLTAPIDVLLDNHNLVQPDILFIAKERKSIIQRRGIFGVPDLIVEILSPSSLRYDRHTKKNIYERFDLREYWIVDPGNRAVEVFLLEGETYTLAAVATESGSLTSSVIEGLVIDLADIFDR